MRTPARTLPLLLLLAACKGETELPPELLITATELDFGVVPVGQEGEASFTLSNGGDGEIELLSVQLTEGDPDRFDVDRGGSLLLAGDLTLDVTVIFSPRNQDRSLGLIQVRYDDGSSGSISVDLVGEGGPSEADDDEDGVKVNEGDCDDNDPNTYPGATELCDGRDNDCDGSVDDEEADADSDGVRVCEGDCDDNDRLVYPGADEICDDKDSDCDGSITDNSDVDGDGVTICGGDCDDEDLTAFPGMVEICDGVDNDCSGSVDDIDLDGDGHSTCSDAGDCDDNDASAYPIVVDPSYTGTEQRGTDEAPFRDVTAALAAIDQVCQTVWLAEGSYTVSLSLGSGDAVTFAGAAQDTVSLSPPSGQRVFDLSDGAHLGLEDLTLTGATASGDGGAVRAVDATVSLRGVAFTGNTSNGDGGALSASSSTVLVEGCLFDGNTALDDGGAIALLSASFSDVGSTYTGNSGVRGGAIVSDGAALELLDATMERNTASDKGGAVAVISGSGLVIEGGWFALNSASASGGGLSFTDVSIGDAVVRNNVLQDNDGGGAGGGISVTGSQASFELVNNTLFANVASGEGAGLSVTAPGSLAVYNNIVGWSDGASGLYVASASGHAVTHNSAYATSSGADFAGAVSADTDNNLDLDPQFQSWSDNRDPSDDDLRLGSGSHCRNSGREDSRFNDQDGSRNDRGYTGGPAAP